MKTLTVFAVALLSAGVVFADAASAADAGKTREQVVSELARARASGEIDALNSDNPAFFLRTPAGSTGKSRAQVQAELKKSVESGEFATLNSDEGSYAQIRNVAASHSSKTRAQVLAELRQAQQSGELAALNSEDPMAYPRFAANRDAQKKAAETLAE